jgi:hypothetical protein
MSRADFYFITKLHLMFNKSTLKSLSRFDGTSMAGAFVQKKLIEKHRLNEENNDLEIEQTYKEESMIEMLEQMFHSFAGGGMSLEKLKESIRLKIQNIKPRE